MKRVEIKQMTLRNFKGTRDLTIQFGNKTLIEGDNKEGKTTVVDAHRWLWDGKNSNGETDFEIKPLDENNEPIHRLSSEVEQVLSDGTRLLKTYREKWTRKRGSDTEELTGHTTDHFINDVPMSKSEYEVKINELIDPTLSRLLSDLKYFNEIIDWKQRRDIISKIAGDITTEEIQNNTPENVQDVISMLNQGKDITDEKKRVSAQKKIIKEELKLIPAKIEEVNRMTLDDIDFESIEKSIAELEAKKAVITSEINDISKSYQKQSESIAEMIKLKSDKQRHLSLLESDLQKQHSPKNDTLLRTLEQKQKELSQVQIELSDKRAEQSRAELKIESLEKELTSLRATRKEIKAREFNADANATTCPTCKREYDNATEKLEQMRSNFNEQKVLELNENERVGSGKAVEVTNLREQLQQTTESITFLVAKLDPLKTELEAIKSELNAPTKAPEPTEEIIKLREEIESFVIPQIERPDVQSLNDDRMIIDTKIDELKTELRKKDQAKQAKERIEELNKQRRALSQEVADMERIEFQIETYQNAEMDLVERKVNDLFTIVKFKMFNKQVNGGIDQTCVAMVDGVPYKSLNTAGKIQASLDIINTLQHYYSVFTPVFIDNAESISEIPPMQCQTVELYMVKGVKKLQIYNLD